MFELFKVEEVTTSLLKMNSSKQKLSEKSSCCFCSFTAVFLHFSELQRGINGLARIRRGSATYLFYLFVNSAELGVLVEQQQLLLIARGDSHALSDQGDLLLCGQQPVPHRTDILRPACTQTLSEHA